MTKQQAVISLRRIADWIEAQARFVRLIAGNIESGKLQANDLDGFIKALDRAANRLSVNVSGKTEKHF